MRAAQQATLRLTETIQMQQLTLHQWQCRENQSGENELFVRAFAAPKRSRVLNAMTPTNVPRSISSME
jgi:hypothetical protein